MDRDLGLKQPWFLGSSILRNPHIYKNTPHVFFFKREYIDVGKHIKAHQSPRKGLNRSKMSKSCRLGAYSWMADPVIFAYSLFFLGENCKWIHILGPCIMMIMINYVYYYMFSCYHYHCIRIVWKLCVCVRFQIDRLPSLNPWNVGTCRCTSSWSEVSMSRYPHHMLES